MYHASNTLLYLHVYLLLNCDRTEIPALCKYPLVCVPRMGGNAMLVFQGKKTNLKRKIAHANFACIVLSFNKNCIWWSVLGFVSDCQLTGWGRAFGCIKLLPVLVGNVFFFSFENQTCGPLFQGPAANKKQVLNNSKRKISFHLWPHSCNTTCLATSLSIYTGSLQRKFPRQEILGQVKTE